MTDSDEVKLLPCLWCRHEGHSISDNGRGLYFTVQCGNGACRAVGPWERCEADAISTWNALTRPPVVTDEVVGLKALEAEIALAMQKARDEIGATEQQKIAFMYAEAAMRSVVSAETAHD